MNKIIKTPSAPEIEIQGIPYRCVEGTTSKGGFAKVDMFTPLSLSEKDSHENYPQIFNRILISIDESNRNAIKELKKQCRKNLNLIKSEGYSINPDFSSLSARTEMIENMLVVKNGSFKCPENIDFSKPIENTIRGVIINIQKSKFLSSMDILIGQGNNVRPSVFPVFINKKKSPKIWNDMNGSLIPGTAVEIKGQVKSEAFNSGNGRRIILQMTDPKKISILDIKKKQIEENSQTKKVSL